MDSGLRRNDSLVIDQKYIKEPLINASLRAKRSNLLIRQINSLEIAASLRSSQ